jgi:hypothetical protein
VGRTEQELKDASEHVKYEIHMLMATASFLSKYAGAADQVTQNAYIESFVLHLRNLIDFFYPPQDAKDLMLAEHYVSSVANWNDTRPAMTERLLDAKRRANKLAAHLSYKRIVTDKRWGWAAILAELQRLISCFLSNLPLQRKAWFAGCEEGPGGPSRPPSPPQVRVTTGPFGPPTSGGPTPSATSGATGPAGPPSSGESATRK